MAHRITVTQLKCAVLDPAWRKRWLAGENPSTLVFSPAGAGKSAESGNGIDFRHKIPPGNRPAGEVVDQPRTTCDGSSNRLLGRSPAISLAFVVAGLHRQAVVEGQRAGSHRVHRADAQLLQKADRSQEADRNFENWQDVFVFTEEDIKGIRLPVGGNNVEIAGRVDAIRFHPRNELEVVDYKLSQGAQQKSDLVQLSIYAHLLPLWRPGCQFRGTLEYYLPEFMEVNISRDELAGIYDGLVLPVLHEMFAAEPEGTAENWEPAAAGRPRDPPKAIRRSRKSIVTAFGSFGLGVEAVGTIEGPQVIRVRLRPASGVKVASLANRAADLQVALALDQPPLISPGKGFVAVDVPRADRQTMLLLGYLKGAGAKEKEPDGIPGRRRNRRTNNFIRLLRFEHLPCARGRHIRQRQERMA